MGIRYINAEPNAKFTRPTGFVFPVGLNTLNPTISYLIVAGGGGGGQGNAGGYGCGGGGAGGYKTGTTTLTFGTSYSVVVGAGGPGGTSSNQGTNGNASSGLGVSSTVVPCGYSLPDGFVIIFSSTVPSPCIFMLSG